MTVNGYTINSLKYVLCFAFPCMNSFPFNMKNKSKVFMPHHKLRAVNHPLLQIPTPNVSFSYLYSSFLEANYHFNCTQPESSRSFQLLLGTSSPCFSPQGARSEIILNTFLVIWQFSNRGSKRIFMIPVLYGFIGRNKSF